MISGKFLVVCKDCGQQVTLDRDKVDSPRGAIKISPSQPHLEISCVCGNAMRSNDNT